MPAAIVFFVIGTMYLYNAESAFMQVIGGIVAIISYFCMLHAWNNRNKNNTE